MYNLNEVFLLQSYKNRNKFRIWIHDSDYKFESMETIILVCDEFKMLDSIMLKFPGRIRNAFVLISVETHQQILKEAF